MSKKPAAAPRGDLENPEPVATRKRRRYARHEPAGGQHGQLHGRWYGSVFSSLLGRWLSFDAHKQKPVLHMEVEHSENRFFKCVALGMQGWRVNMEDAHLHMLGIRGRPDEAMFGVYDGHGGEYVSRYAGQRMHPNIMQQKEFEIGGNMVAALQQGFAHLDQEVSQLDSEEYPGRNDFTGSTAVVVVCADQKIYCGNLGDSRAVVSIAGNPYQLSIEHKPTDLIEMNRVYGNGSFIREGRVNGNLALCRALGDFYFKAYNEEAREEEPPWQDFIVAPFADVTMRDFTDDYEFMIIACDGIWDVFTNREAITFVRERLAAGVPLEDIGVQFLRMIVSPDPTFSGIGADNMTLMIILFTNGQGEQYCRNKCRTAPMFPPIPQKNLQSFTYTDDKRLRLKRIDCFGIPDSQKEILPPELADACQRQREQEDKAARSDGKEK